MKGEKVSGGSVNGDGAGKAGDIKELALDLPALMRFDGKIPINTRFISSPEH